MAHDSGQVDAALKRYAAIQPEVQDDDRVGAEVLTLHAIGCAQQGRFARAHALFRAAVEASGSKADARSREAIGEALDALTAPAVVPRERSEAAEQGRSPDTPWDRAHRVLERVAAEPGCWLEDRSVVYAAAVDHVLLRLAARALDRALDAAQPGPAPMPPDALIIGDAGRWFRMPGGQPVSLERRRPLALILARLGSARIESPGQALSWEIVQDAGWPGERILAAAGAHRVRVAISTLRKLGLRDALRTTPDGYLIDAGLLVLQTDQSERDASS